MTGLKKTVAVLARGATTPTSFAVVAARRAGPAVEVPDTFEVAGRSLIEWRDAVAQFQGDLRSRQLVDAQLLQQSSAHAKSVLGREAVRWVYRERLVDDSARWRLALGDAQRRELVEAETSFFSRLPFSKALFTKSPHLGDQELSRLLGTKDLRAFADETKARVEAKVGPWAAYLARADRAS